MFVNGENTFIFVFDIQKLHVKYTTIMNPLCDYFYRERETLATFVQDKDVSVSISILDLPPSYEQVMQQSHQQRQRTTNSMKRKLCVLFLISITIVGLGTIAFCYFN